MNNMAKKQAESNAITQHLANKKNYDRAEKKANITLVYSLIKRYEGPKTPVRHSYELQGRHLDASTEK